MPEVKIGGQWLQSFGRVTQVKWASRWGDGPCGPDLASCTVALDPSNDSSWLRQNVTFEVFNDAGKRVFAGPTTDVGRGAVREIAAKSWGRLASQFDAVDASGNPSTKPQSSINQAITNGLAWSAPTGFDDTPLGTDGGAQSNRLDTLLSSWAAKNGKRWQVDVNGVPSAVTDATSPTWLLDAYDLDIGTADDGLFTRVRARYVSAVTGTTPTAWSSVVANDTAGQGIYGIIEYPMDLTPLGLMTSTTASGYAQQQLDLLTVPQWLTRVTTNRQRLLTLGGHGADVQDVQAGQVVRLFNVPNGLGGLRAELGLDVVLGEVEYDSDNPDEVTIAPVNLAVVSLADQFAQAAQAAAKLDDELVA